MTEQTDKEIETLKKSIGNIEKEVALLQQFNVKVVEPSLSSIRQTLELGNYATRDEIDKRFEVQEERNAGFVTKTEFKIGLGTITVILSIIVALSTVWDKLT